MLPVNYGGHAAYQDTFVSRFLDLFPDPFAVPKQTWDKDLRLSERLQMRMQTEVFTAGLQLGMGFLQK